MATEQEIEGEGWIRAARYVLIFTGLCYLPFIAVGPFMAATTFNKPGVSADFNHAFGIGFSVILGVICVGVASLNFAAAWGLGKGKRWAWILGVILGGLYAPSICLPFGVVILYGLLRDPSQRLFAPPRPG